MKQKEVVSLPAWLEIKKLQKPRASSPLRSVWIQSFHNDAAGPNCLLLLYYCLCFYEMPLSLSWRKALCYVLFLRATLSIDGRCVESAHKRYWGKKKCGEKRSRPYNIQPQVIRKHRAAQQRTMEEKHNKMRRNQSFLIGVYLIDTGA